MNPGIVFHYQTKDLFSGYQEGFFPQGKKSQDACISTGNSLEKSRFYFADLAAEGYLRKELGGNANDFFEDLRNTMEHINVAIFHIVTGFIKKRGFGWRQPRED